MCQNAVKILLSNSFFLNIYFSENEYFIFTEKYFDMNKKHARDALDLYKKFLIRMDRVADFLKVAEVSYSKIWN